VIRIAMEPRPDERRVQCTISGEREALPVVVERVGEHLAGAVPFARRISARAAPPRGMEIAEGEERGEVEHHPSWSCTRSLKNPGPAELTAVMRPPPSMVGRSAPQVS